MPRPRKAKEATPVAMQFVSRIRGARDVHTLSRHQFAEKFRAKKGAPDFTLQEYFQGSTDVTVFYDWDAKYPEQPSPGALGGYFRDFKTALTTLHPDVPEGSFRYAQRHGWVVDKDGCRKWKVSFRAWVRGTVAAAADIPQHIREMLPNDRQGGLDFSPYKVKEQLLAVIGGCKDLDQEKRHLTPIDGDGRILPADEIDPAEYLAQDVAAGSVRVGGAGGTGAGTGTGTAGGAGKKRGRKPKAAPAGADGGVSGEAGPSGTAGAGGGKEILAGEEHADVLRDSTDFFGEKYRMQERLTAIHVDREHSSLIFPTKKKWCFIKRDHHVHKRCRGALQMFGRGV
jgi:hypothetical protein